MRFKVLCECTVIHVQAHLWSYAQWHAYLAQMTRVSQYSELACTWSYDLCCIACQGSFLRAQGLISQSSSSISSSSLKVVTIITFSSSSLTHIVSHSIVVSLVALCAHVRQTLGYRILCGGDDRRKIFSFADRFVDYIVIGVERELD